jgi:Cu-processing system permease protein
VGLAAGAFVVVLGSGADGIGGFALFTAAAAALAIVFLALAAAIAAATDKRVAALGIGTFVWFFFVLLYDGAMLSAAGWLTGASGGRVLFGSVFGNPADLVRVMTLSWAGTPNVLGAAGDAWLRFLGGTPSAAAASVGALLLWTIVPLAAAVQLINRRDL